MAERAELKFQAKLRGDVKYKLDTTNFEGKKIPGFAIDMELNTNQIDKAELLDHCDGNLVRVQMKNVEGTTRLAFDTTITGIDFAVRTENEESIPIAKFPIVVSRNQIEADGGIVSLLDLRGNEWVNVNIFRKQGALALAAGKKADDKKDADEGTAPEKPANRKPRGFGKSIN